MLLFCPPSSAGKQGGGGGEGGEGGVREDELKAQLADRDREVKGLQSQLETAKREVPLMCSSL